MWGGNATNGELDLLPSIRPQRLGNAARLLVPGRMRLESAAALGRPHQEFRVHRSAVLLLMVCNWGQIGANTYTLRWGYRTAVPINSGFSGRCDRNRTCNLRFWRSRRCVPDHPVQSYCAEYSLAFMRVQAHTVPFRSVALLPFLLPPRPPSALLNTLPRGRRETRLRR
jgi:hypothetical protein